MKNVLIAVTGETPQILTEAIYYYLQKDHKFDEITVLTTKKGFEKLKTSLFRDKILEKLYQAVNKPPSCAPFSKKDIIIFQKEGKPIMDVRTDDEINTATKTFYQVLQKYTAREDTKIIANIAGGRKNMGASLALGMQLFGREQDEMIHVLVKEQVENRNSWFYPQKEEEKDYIDVSSIPFIRVRNYVKNAFVDKMEPEDILELAQSNLEYNAPIRKVVIKGNTFEIDDRIKFELSPSQSMMIRFLALQKIKKCKFPEKHNCLDCTGCFLSPEEMIAEYLDFMKVDYPKIGKDGYVSIAKNKNYDITKITVDITRTNTGLKEKIAHPKYQDLFTILRIPDIQDKRIKRCGLSVDQSIIELIE